MESEPLLPEESTKQPKGPTISDLQASLPNRKKPPYAVIGAILLLAIIGVTVYLVWSKGHSRQSGDASTVSDDTTESESENSQPKRETHTGQHDVTYLGMLNCTYVNGVLEDCTIPSTAVKNGKEGYVYTLDYSSNYGDLGFDYIAPIKRDGNTYTVTIPANSEVFPNLDGEKSFSYTFDEAVTSSAISILDQSSNHEHALFVTESGALYYVNLSQIIAGNAEMKKAESVGDVAVLMRGDVYYNGSWTTDYAVCMDGSVYDLSDIVLKGKDSDEE